MYNPLVSIIIPVFNGSNYLAEAIDCALKQTYKNIEVIVVNDGSNDNGKSESIALSYGKKIRYFSKENGGSSSAVNIGIDNMEGEWFSWLAHDDLYYPQKIKKQVELINKLIENNHDINLDKQVIHSSGECIDTKGNHLFKIKSKSTNGLTNIEIIIEALKNIRFNLGSFLLPKACFYAIGKFDEKLRLINDYEYLYRLLYSDYKFHYVPEVLVKNRLHKKQISYSIGFSASNNEHTLFWNNLIDWIHSNKEFCKAEYFYRIGKYAAYSKKNIEANRAFSCALSLSSKYKIIITFTKVYILFYIFLRGIAKRLYIKVKL